jgi:hypothetical protein
MAAPLSSYMAAAAVVATAVAAVLPSAVAVAAVVSGAVVVAVPAQWCAVAATSPAAPIAVPDLMQAATLIARDQGGRFERGDRGRFVERHDRGERFEHRRFAERGHDFDRFHHRHRVFVNGVWVWDWWPDYYAYNDCWWLRRQALITGSPYWWSRYNSCVGYY